METSVTRRKTTRMTSLNAVHIKPSPATFGTLCQGYVYALKIKIQNHTNQSIRLKAECLPLDEQCNDVSISYLPIQLAPGMETSLTINTVAIAVSTHKYRFRVVYGYYEKHSLEELITAYVLPVPLYKNVSRQMHLNGKKIMLENVSSLHRINGFSFTDSIPFSPNETHTVDSQELLDTEEMDEMIDLPLIPCCYWDHKKQRLVLDEELNAVRVYSRFFFAQRL